MLWVTLTSLATLFTKGPSLALVFTLRAFIPRSTQTLAVSWVTVPIIQTVTFLGAVVTIVTNATGFFTMQTDKSWCAVTVAILKMADAAILAGTHLRAVSAKPTVRARLITSLTCVSFLTLTFPSHVMTKSAVQAVALLLAFVSVIWRRTWFAARDPAVTRATDTLSSTRMTAVCVCGITLTRDITVISVLPVITGSYGAGGSNKPWNTAAGARHVIASTTVLTVALFRAKLSIEPNGALFRAFFADVPC